MNDNAQKQSSVMIALPPVLASGGRHGYHLAVTDVRHGVFYGEKHSSGVTELEMLPGDLLLSVKPVGKSHDSSKTAALFRVMPDSSLALLMAAPWPNSQERLASRALAAMSARKVFSRQTNGDIPAGQSILVPEDEFREAAEKAFAAGVTPARAMAIVASIRLNGSSNCGNAK